MEREQTTDTGKMSGRGSAPGFEQSENLLKIRLPAELKEQLQQEAEWVTCLSKSVRNTALF